ncbi:carbohydrate ABC transporter permease [Microbispora bryophytorum]|uniref:Sugar ABC transporter n=2 Tax=Microbispora bryophytorum TaxID=1460882 RepID=A0A8H9H130_9ACTN|nr:MULTISPECIES: carbohydrate ABC transporter permease [Microbispora]MBD3136442.1 carbohydrate ABC transporter permease [Microbispora bryophytorum]MBD3146568.1 carbohydrate ABC transporter permease [Microbispora camponoti]TQS01706.1 carbohydrate ABC transporter permease [Microbispora bryophytorum]GGO18994.1 sugar ABC transporter [Microbispora bryophytorum]
MRPLRIGLTLRILGVLVVLGVAVFPLYWMIVTALSSNSDLFAEKARLVPDFSQFGVFIDALAEGKALGWLRNSLVIAVGTTVLSIGLGIPLGYALSRFSFWGKAIVTVLLLFTQMLPEALMVVPLFSLFRRFGLLDSLGGLILVNSAFVLPIVALILKGAIDGIPRALEESARVDGARPLTVLTRINVPLIAPSIAATAVIAFFHAWNEYVFAVTFIFTPGKQPASVGIANFIGELGTPIQTVMAVAFMFTLPAVVFYLFAQRHVVAGMTAGAVKG